MSVKITGIDQVNTILTAIAPREARNIITNTVFAMAGVLAKDAKTHAPNDPKTPGNYADGFKAKRERMKRNVVSASAIVTGLDQAFIWRFHEYGQGPDGVEHAMWLKAFQAMKPDVDEVYMREFGKALEKRLARLAKKAG